MARMLCSPRRSAISFCAIVACAALAVFVMPSDAFAQPASTDRALVGDAGSQDSRRRAEHFLSLSESAAHPGDSERYAELALREPEASTLVRAVARQRWLDGAIGREDWKLVEILASHPNCAAPDRTRTRTLLGVRRWSPISMGVLGLWAICALFGWARSARGAMKSLRTQVVRPFVAALLVSFAGVLAAMGFRADPMPFFYLGLGASVISLASLGLLGHTESFARSAWIRWAIASLTAAAVVSFAFLLVAYRFPNYLSVFRLE